MASPFTNAGGESYVRDIVWNGYDANLKPEVVAVLNAAQALVDFPIVLRSGYRSPERNRAVGGAKASEHLSGNAVDVSLNGLSNAQRTQLTRAFVQAGAPRLGVYSGNTGMHVDMKQQGPAKGYPVWPMYDKSFDNMDRAPKWFTAGLDGAPIPPGGMPSDPPIPSDMPGDVQTTRLAYATEGSSSGQPQTDLISMLERRAAAKPKADPVGTGAKRTDLLDMLETRAGTGLARNPFPGVPKEEVDRILETPQAIYDPERQAFIPEGDEYISRATSPRPFQSGGLGALNGARSVSMTDPAGRGTVAVTAPARVEARSATLEAPVGAGRRLSGAVAVPPTVGPARGGVAEEFAQSGASLRAGPAPGKESRFRPTAVPPSGVAEGQKPVPFERIGNPDDQQIARARAARTVAPTPMPRSAAADARARAGIFTGDEGMDGLFGIEMDPGIAPQGAAPPPRTQTPLVQRAPVPATMSAGLRASARVPVVAPAVTPSAASSRRSSSPTRAPTVAPTPAPTIARATNGYLYERTGNGWQRVGRAAAPAARTASSSSRRDPSSFETLSSSG